MFISGDTHDQRKKVRTDLGFRAGSSDVSMQQRARNRFFVCARDFAVPTPAERGDLSPSTSDKTPIRVLAVDELTEFNDLDGPISGFGLLRLLRSEKEPHWRIALLLQNRYSVFESIEWLL
jgi:hypothetical protein